MPVNSDTKKTPVLLKNCIDSENSGHNLLVSVHLYFLTNYHPERMFIQAIDLHCSKNECYIKTTNQNHFVTDNEETFNLSNLEVSQVIENSSK